MELTPNYTNELRKNLLYHKTNLFYSKKFNDHLSDIEDVFIRKNISSESLWGAIDFITDRPILDDNFDIQNEVSIVELEDEIGVLGQILIPEKIKEIYKELFEVLRTNDHKIKLEFFSKCIKIDNEPDYDIMDFRTFLFECNYSKTLLRVESVDDNYCRLFIYLSIQKLNYQEANNRLLKKKYYRLIDYERKLHDIIDNMLDQEFVNHFPEIEKQMVISTGFNESIIHGSKFLLLCLSNNILSPFKELKKFDLHWKLEALPDSVWNLTKLEKFHFHGGGEKYSPGKLKVISDQIRKLIKLKHMYLCGTQINKIPETIGELINLEYLIMHTNKIQELPKTLGNLLNLKELCFDDNDLEIIPEFLGKLTSLEVLSIRDNNIEIFPKSLCNLQNLRDIRLRNNKIKEIPKEIGKMTNLQELRLEGNPIKTLPKELEQINLKRLNITGTKINIKDLSKKIRNIICDF